jgi:hypothetical protein
MKTPLEDWLRNKLQEVEKMHDYAIATETVKIWINEWQALTKSKTPAVKKSYKLKINYMIGDADGYTDLKSVISIDNSFLKLFTGALDKLKGIEGEDDFQLSTQTYLDNLERKLITEKEYDLLCLIDGYCMEEDRKEFLAKHFKNVLDTDHQHLIEFAGLLTSETEYSYLTYQYYTLK